jgi:hypothetical protein
MELLRTWHVVPAKAATKRLMGNKAFYVKKHAFLARMVSVMMEEKDMSLIFARLEQTVRTVSQEKIQAIQMKIRSAKKVAFTLETTSVTMEVKVLTLMYVSLELIAVTVVDQGIGMKWKMRKILQQPQFAKIPVLTPVTENVMTVV